jgi:hypothetical protein
MFVFSGDRPDGGGSTVLALLRSERAVSASAGSRAEPEFLSQFHKRLWQLFRAPFVSSMSVDDKVLLPWRMERCADFAGDENTPSMSSNPCISLGFSGSVNPVFLCKCQEGSQGHNGGYAPPLVTNIKVQILAPFPRGSHCPGR